VAGAVEDARERLARARVVVDDEDLGFAQGTLRGAEGASAV